MKENKDFKSEGLYSERQVDGLIRWQKIQRDGKWLWIFKRAAMWLTAALFIYGFGAWSFPSFFNFDRIQFYIIFGMLGGFVTASIMEWSEMEGLYLDKR